MVQVELRKQLLTMHRRSSGSNCLNAVAGSKSVTVLNISFAKFKLPSLQGQILVLARQLLRSARVVPCVGKTFTE